MSTVDLASVRAWVRSALPVSRAMVRASSSTRASSASAIRASSRARPGGKGIGRGFHRARDIFGAAPRHLGDWTSVRWIFNFEPLARNAVDPFAADQHALFLRRGLVFTYFGDSRHCHLHHFFYGRDPP